ncbi:hypothetical protein HDU78_008801, partial [Chytriomyces hyalinus]
RESQVEKQPAAAMAPADTPATPAAAAVTQDVATLANEVQGLLNQVAKETAKCALLARKNAVPPAPDQRQYSGVDLSSSSELTPVTAGEALSGWTSPTADASMSQFHTYDYFISSHSAHDDQLALELYMRLKIAVTQELLNSTESAETVREKDRHSVYSSVSFRTNSGNGLEPLGIEQLKKSKVIILLISASAIRSIREKKVEDEYLRREWEVCRFAHEFKMCVVFPIFIGDVFAELNASAGQCERSDTLLTALFQLQGFNLIDRMPLSVLVEKAKLQKKLFSEIRTDYEKSLRTFAHYFTSEKHKWDAAHLIFNRALSAGELECVIASLAFNTTWKKVSLQQCEGFQDGRTLEVSLGSCLRHNTCLVVLDLSFNWISDEWAIELSSALKQVIPSVTQLRDLKLNNNQIGRAGLLALLKMLAQVPISNLDLSHNSLNESCNSVINSHLPATFLAELDVSHNPGFKIGSQAIINSQLSKLQVGYSDCLSGDTYLESLNASNLTSLHVASCNISEVGLTCLAENNQLQELNLSENELIQNRIVMTTLAHSLSVGATGLTALHISSVDLANVIHILAVGLEKNSFLTHLTLQSCGLVSASAEALAAAISSTNSVLQTLDVSRNEFGFHGVKTLIDLQDVTGCTLRELCVSKCGILPEQELPLLNLAKLCTLDALDISGNFTKFEQDYDSMVNKPRGLPDLTSWHE